eukprot:TRINITY_DN9458_c0_g1_i1.p1 TRINITY_DN9458_c0_g1~~TRINITY_DN9458_c0_g1_i1.p1  ORF type:complete len:563 (-),score=114.55 TRINITY_DN9458_c0_g1_i1:36-1697(-)
MKRFDSYSSTSSTTSSTSESSVALSSSEVDYVTEFGDCNVVLNVHHPLIEWNEIELSEEHLGSGSFGTVWKGRVRRMTCAIKELHPRKFDSEEDFTHWLNTFKKECEVILGVGGHPNIVQFLGYCLQVEHLCIVTELVPNGDLEGLLKEPSYSKTSLYKRILMMKDIAAGICWLHQRENHQIIHQDLKPSNILVAENGVLKLCDFGLSTLYDSNKHVLEGRIGSAIWMAPEALSGDKHDEKVDIFSWALIAWQILTGETMPYKKYWLSDSFEELFQGKCVNQERPIIPESTSSLLANIIISAWNANPRKRPSASELCDRIDECKVYSTIEDDKACDFWYENWSKSESIFFEEFMSAFYDFINVEMPDYPESDVFYGCLEALVETRGVVTLQKFINLCNWFDINESVLVKIKNLLGKTWFRGYRKREKISYDLVDDNLKDKRNYCLIRFNTSYGSNHFPYICSFKRKREKIIRHALIIRDKDANGNVYYAMKLRNIIKSDTIEGLVEALRLKKLRPLETNNQYHPIFMSANVYSHTTGYLMPSMSSDDSLSFDE